LGKVDVVQIACGVIFVFQLFFVALHVSLMLCFFLIINVQVCNIFNVTMNDEVDMHSTHRQIYEI